MIGATSLENWIFAYVKNKDADQLCSNCTADQCLCFRLSDSTISLHLKSEISSFLPTFVIVQTSSFQT